jgi:hypothetical protein
MIDRDGKIIPFMADNAVAYHAGNTDKNRKFGNWNTIGIAAAANDNNDVTPEQQASAAKLAKELSQKYGFDIQNVFGHGQVSSQKLPTEGVALVDAVKSGGGTATQVPPAPTTGAVVGSASSEVATGHRQQMTVDRGSQTTVVAPTNNTVNKSKTVRRNDFVDTDMSVAASMGMGA